MTRIEEALTEWFGTRCDDYEPSCACCQAWREYDGLRDGLTEALCSWEEAAQYKGDYLMEKHGDMEDIERIRSSLT